MYESTQRIIRHTLPPHLWERLRRYAIEREMSTSDVLEMSLTQFFESDREDRLGERLRSARTSSDYEPPRAT